MPKSKRHPSVKRARASSRGRRAAGARQDLNDLYRVVVSTLTEGVLLIDARFRIVAWNDSALRILGVSANQLPKRLAAYRAWNIVHENGQPCPMDEWPAVRSLRTGQTYEHAVVGVTRLDGRTRWLSLNSKPLFKTGQKRPYAAVVSFFDVTERKVMMEALRESQTFFEQAQTVAHLGSWVSDPQSDGRLTWSKETCRIFGFKEEEFDGRVETFFRHVHPDDLDAVRKASRDALENGAPYAIDHRIVRRDGAVRWVHECAEIFRDESGKALRMVGTVQDITEQRMIQERLRESHKMEAIERLSGGIAHDFNNLLTAIAGYAKLLLENNPSSMEARSDIQEIIKATEQASDLTYQLMVLGRRQAPHLRRMDVNRLVFEMQTILRRLLGPEIKLRMDLAPNLSAVRIDPSQMEQILINLALHTRDVMRHGGNFIIRTENADSAFPDGGSGVRLLVRDSGPGMNEETRNRLFEPFGTASTSPPGAGLRLAAIYAMVTQCGGTIQAESDPVKGNAYHIVLPVDKGSAEVPQRGAAEAVDVRGSETVLLVEENAAVRRMLGRTLRGFGYRVFEVESGDHAMQLAQRHELSIDVLITDTALSQMSGQELAERVSSLHAGLKVLYLSSAEPASARSAAVMDAAFLQKPFRVEDLARRVRELSTAPVAGENVSGDKPSRSL